MTSRDSFIFYRSFYESLEGLSTEQRAKIYVAICEFSLNFKDTKFDGILKVVWLLIKPQLEANNQRFINGKRPKKRSKTEAKPKQDRSEIEANKNKNVNNNKNKNVNNNENKEIEGQVFDLNENGKWIVEAQMILRKAEIQFLFEDDLYFQKIKLSLEQNFPEKNSLDLFKKMIEKMDDWSRSKFSMKFMENNLPKFLNMAEAKQIKLNPKSEGHEQTLARISIK